MPLTRVRRGSLAGNEQGDLMDQSSFQPATLRNIDQLCDHAFVPRERLDELAAVAARYAVAITPLMADAIDRSDPHDPIARQFVPDARELIEQPEERRDPITAPTPAA